MSPTDPQTAPDAPPTTATEQAIAEIWRSLFGVTEVTVVDDFFELGGNSLTAVKFLARVEERFGLDVLLPETLYEDARLGSLATAIDQSPDQTTA